MASTVPPPNRACPKCGEPVWRGPQYQPETTQEVRHRQARVVVVPNSLLFTCSTCGFSVTVPTLDAGGNQPAPPGPPA